MQGKDLFNTLNTIEKNTMLAKPELNSWTKYNFLITTTGKGKDTKRIAMARDTETEVVSEEVLAQKVPLSTVLIELSIDEIGQAVRGVSLKDLFAARNATKDTEKSLEDQVSQEAKDIVEGLMN